jgi:6-pyruvoyltetrahydropterin/6-carboxytetrahydropterin synthase
MITAERYHDISCGHRVYGHESKCAHLHGHNYRIHFKVKGDETPNNQTGLDNIGRVLDFSVIKSALCMWLEDNWDHKFLIWHKDPWADHLYQIDRKGLVLTDFNPTAENMADHLLTVVGPAQLKNTGCALISVRIEETMKCSATSELFV